MAAIRGAWEAALQGEFAKDYYRALYRRVRQEYETQVVYPKSEDIFNAFHLTDLDAVKVVILGQDPYHEPGQAHGLSFSVQEGTKCPPSLVNIYKEMSADLGCPMRASGDLTVWAKQGVLLLNTVLTVRAHVANSHRGIGWEQFTDAAIDALEKEARPMVYILWGAQARKKKERIVQAQHLVIESAHPSPLSAHNGFFGSRPFSRTNDFLAAQGLAPIDWLRV